MDSEDNTPETCGNYNIDNVGEITSWEYNEFQEIVSSNIVSTPVTNPCPVAECILNISKKWIKPVQI